MNRKPEGVLVDAARLLRLLFLPIVVSGCATLAHGPTQEIAIYSSPPGAMVFVDGVDTQRTTPTTVRVNRRSPPTLRVEHEGHQPAVIRMKRSLDGWIWWNFLTFGVGAIVDFATGSAYRASPYRLVVDFREDVGTPIVTRF